MKYLLYGFFICASGIASAAHLEKYSFIREEKTNQETIKTGDKLITISQLIKTKDDGGGGGGEI